MAVGERRLRKVCSRPTSSGTGIPCVINCVELICLSLQNNQYATTNSLPSSAWLSDTHSNVMTKLQENHNELQTTITTLQKMAISPPKEVLDQLTQVLGLLATIGNVSESITEIKNISLGLQRLERKCEEGELYTLMKWMTPTEPQVRHKEMAQSRLKNTGDWFTEMVDFQNWKGTSDFPGSQIFGCYG
ncbi:hypothetical protein FPQ18DRAFT_25255 [Pyronema domesticum]|nr:hypothetical protein FPQ18DRAFT_25255 [Pyronema domesticum]